MYSPCGKRCQQFNPFASELQYLFNEMEKVCIIFARWWTICVGCVRLQSCNDCLMSYTKYPWHAFTKNRLVGVAEWTKKMGLCGCVVWTRASEEIFVFQTV